MTQAAASKLTLTDTVEMTRIRIEEHIQEKKVAA